MVNVKILDESGHTELVLEAEGAVETIKDRSQKGEWVYVDGKYYPLPEITRNVGGCLRVHRHSTHTGRIGHPAFFLL
jgi:hypothetical protein